MLTLNRHTDDGGWEYREAWFDEEAGEFVVHHGTVGRNGTITAETAGAEQAEGLVESFRAQCAADGFAEPDPAELIRLEVVYPLKGATPGAAEERNVTQVHTAALTWLAWRGLGALQDPEQAARDGSQAMVMALDTLHRRKATETVAAAVRSTDVQPTRIRVARRPQG
ncbi:hypothetical protein GCM10027060_04980 [Nesterenkonia halophila]|uniref:hypothetical protein n=1 Tax=Nesterenkonia halophila TaxID=302044 RepID=UPI001291C2B9|nr:hypothetical protein [Nesterenkonia halophila]